jgi:hypothetical protein
MPGEDLIVTKATRFLGYPLLRMRFLVQVYLDLNIA